MIAFIFCAIPKIECCNGCVAYNCILRPGIDILIDQIYQTGLEQSLFCCQKVGTIQRLLDISQFCFGLRQRFAGFIH